MQALHRCHTTKAFVAGLALVVILSISYFLAAHQPSRFNGDESGWISAGFYYSDLLLSGDFNREAWECHDCVAWGSLNPHLGKLLIGLPLTLFADAKLEGARFFSLYDFGQPFQSNAAQGRVPPHEMLRAARTITVLFAVLTLAVAFSVAALTADLAAGLILVILLLGNKLFVDLATLTMTDMHYNFFLVCSVLAACWFVARPERAIWASALSGVCAGLAASVKITGVAIVGIAFLCLVIYSLALRQHKLKNGLLFIAVFALSALGVIYLLNPVFWPSLAGIQEAVVLAEFESLLAEAPSAAVPFADTLAVRYPQLGNLARPVELLRLFGRWDQLMELQAPIAGWVTGNRLVDLHSALVHHMLDPLWLLLPFLTGVVHSVRRIVRSFKGKSPDLLIAPLIFFIVNYVFIVAFLTLNWSRYYLPTVIAGGFLIAIGASVLLTELVKLIHHIVASETARRLSRASARAQPLMLHAIPWLLALLLTGLNLSYAARMGINDDAFITLRVARNLANGLGPVFNPGERVLSITNPGYMLLLTASSVFSQDFVALALVWSGLALLALGALLIDASRAGFAARSPAQAALAAAAAVALTLSNPLLSAAVGMETPLYLAALLAVFAAYRRALQEPAHSQRWLLATAAAAAIAFLLRPDGLLAGLVVGVHWLATQRRVPWRALALGLLLALPWVLFAWSYYGSPLPNTLAAKITQGLPDRVGQWGQQLLEMGGDWIAANLMAAALAVVGLALALRRSGVPAAPGVRVRRLMVLWAALYVAIHVTLRVRGYFWYYVPLLPVVALLAGDGAAGVVRWLAGLRGSGPGWRIAHVLLVAVLLVALFAPTLAATGDLIRSELPGQRQIAYQRTALLLRDLCQEAGHEPVGMAEIGILGYVSNCRVLDFSGLLQPDIARLPLPAGEKMAWAIKAYAPPLLVLAGADGYPHEVAGSLWFRQRYEPVDNQDERGFLSTTYRRALGPAQQRDLAVRWPAASEPLTTALVFPLDVTPAMTLHTFLPADSSVAVTAGGAPVLTLAGGGLGWQDVRLPAVQTVHGAVALQMAGDAAGQTAAVAWIESNAVPAVHYFAPFELAAAQPRPSLRLDEGGSAQAVLAPAGSGPIVLDVAYRDRPGVQLAVLVDGQEIAVVGGASDAWQVARFDLPAGALANKSTVEVELRNPVQQFVRVYYAALVDPAQPPYVP